MLAQCWICMYSAGSLPDTIIACKFNIRVGVLPSFQNFKTTAFFQVHEILEFQAVKLSAWYSGAGKL